MKNLILLLFLSLLHFISISQADSSRYCVAFYNLENLFDSYNDSVKNDDAFTPHGLNHWTYAKMKRKTNHIAKVLLTMNEWNPPDIVGVSEIENDYVLRQLCYQTGLRSFQYDFVHFDSPDSRGIDVALLYRKYRVSIVSCFPIPIVFPFEVKSKNRDVLYVKAVTASSDTLHLLVNHWTSRYSGYAATIVKRNYYAEVVRRFTDSLLNIHPNANIIIMGDFNDYPTDESIVDVLHACPYTDSDSVCSLNNLMSRFTKMSNSGSHKIEDFWGCLDQIIVSSSLLLDTNPIGIISKKAEIFMGDFMMVPDEKYGGLKLYRTYLGPRYIGGYSDHLPVFIRLRSQNSICQPSDR